MTNRLLAVAVAASMMGTAAFAKEPAKALTVTPPADLKWEPLVPNNPNGPQVAVVHGDMKKGPASFFIKLPKGYKSGMHIHTADYQAVVVQGTPGHIAEGETEAKPLQVGSFFFQPGKGVHEDSCTGDTECINFIVLAGKMDYAPAGKDAPKPGAKPDAKPAPKK